MTDESEPQRLIVVPNGAGEPRAHLAGCVNPLHRVQAARAAVARLDAPGLRAALDARRSALGKGSAQ